MKEWIKDIAIAVVIALVVVQFVKPTIVKQNSMEPNFQQNDYLFVNRQIYKVKEPKRGEVVVVHSALRQENGDEKLLIKRVIGLPGETLDIREGKVYINGQELEEEYTKDGITNGDISGYVIPEDHVFCMGDNRLVSMDSRDGEVGSIPYGDIVGKVFLRLFPFDRIGFIRNPYNE